MIMDTSGIEKYKTITKSQLKLGDVIVLCYDGRSEVSFNSMKKIFAEDIEKSNEAKLIIAANKSDLKDAKDTLNWYSGADFAKQIKASDYLEVSAKSGNQVDELFLRSVRAFQNFI